MIKMKTVGLVTSEESFLNNYGAALQGYALCQTLKSLGTDPYVIRYKTYIPPRKFGKLKDCIKRIIRYNPDKRSQEQIARDEKLNQIKEQHKDQIRDREAYFEKFQKDFIPFHSDKRYVWDELKENPPVYDIYVCGSDQIWNPYFHGGVCDPGYFLAFAPAGKPCIAYAPSTGTDKFPQTFANDIPKYIDRFREISLREKSSAEALSNLLGRTVPAVLDPTLLADPQIWDNIKSVPARIPEQFILSYRFSDNPVMKEALLRVSAEKGLPVVSVPLSAVALEDPFMKEFHAGPGEFVGLIGKAALVVTDSFHATVFSILQHTPFITFPRESFSDNASMNTRVEDLLRDCDLLHRYVSTVKEAVEMERQAISFCNADAWLNEERTKSLEFLRKALGEG